MQQGAEAASQERAGSGKPLWRGVSHQAAFFTALVLAPALVLQASSTAERVTGTVYGLCLIGLFGCSALLHRGRWSPSTEVWLRRLDHSMIFFFIAGTYTPVVALTLGPGHATPILAVVWLGATAGVGVTVLWIDAPRWITTGCYLAVGWVALLALPELLDALSGSRFALLVAGGVLFSIGAVVYATKRPDPVPDTFGYHEVFHALVIVAAACHYALVSMLILD